MPRPSPGLFGLTSSLALETARKVTVNSVAPAEFIATEMVSAIPEDILNRVIATIPVGRLGEPTRSPELVEFLADPGSGYITGEIIDCNGGLYMWLTKPPPSRAAAHSIDLSGRLAKQVRNLMRARWSRLTPTSRCSMPQVYQEHGIGSVVVGGRPGRRHPHRARRDARRRPAR